MILVLIGAGLLIAGLGWAIGKDHIETLGTILAVTGIAMLLVEHWPRR